MRGRFTFSCADFAPRNPRLRMSALRLGHSGLMSCVIDPYNTNGINVMLVMEMVADCGRFKAVRSEAHPNGGIKKWATTKAR